MGSTSHVDSEAQLADLPEIEPFRFNIKVFSSDFQAFPGNTIEFATVVVRNRKAAADPAPPFSIVDLSDIGAFISGFLSQDSIVDRAKPFGVIDLGDVDRFVSAFLSED